MFVFIAPFPIALVPLVGGGALGAGGAAAKISSFKDFASVLFSYLGYIGEFLKVLLLIAIILILVFSIFRFYNYYFYKRKCRRIKFSLHRFYTEEVLFKNISDFDSKKRLELELSREETIGILKKALKDVFVRRRIGKHHSKRMLDGLDLIVNKKLKQEERLVLINNWLGLIADFL